MPVSMQLTVRNLLSDAPPGYSRWAGEGELVCVWLILAPGWQPGMRASTGKFSISRFLAGLGAAQGRWRAAGAEDWLSGRTSVAGLGAVKK
jgi:hypothetical protein